jgi:hypothetical protein
MPVAGIYLVIKVFAPAFNQKLTLITGSSDGGQLEAIKGNIKPLWGNKLGTLLTTPGPEQMGFDLSWHMMLRSREFKMQVYPGIGYVLVLFIVYTLKSGGFHADSFDISNPENRFAILSVLYAPALLIMGATAQIPLSPFWKASWIYQMSPIEKPGRIICGSTKAVMAQFMLIPFLLIGIFGIIVNGLAILPAWIMAVSIQIMLAYLLSIINVKSLPFSKPPEKAGSSGNFIKVMLTLVLISGLVFLQWSIFSYSWLMLATAALALIITLLLNKQIANTPWNSISFAK